MPVPVDERCSIYDERPEDPCRVFECGWKLNVTMPDWMRPDRSGAILIVGQLWVRPDGLRKVNLIAPAGRRVPPRTENLIRAFSQQTGLNFLCYENVKSNGKFTGLTAVKPIGDDEFEALVKEWRDSGMSFEFKKPGGKLSRQQTNWLGVLRRFGFHAVCEFF